MTPSGLPILPFNFYSSNSLYSILICSFVPSGSYAKCVSIKIVARFFLRPKSYNYLFKHHVFRNKYSRNPNGNSCQSAYLTGTASNFTVFFIKECMFLHFICSKDYSSKMIYKLFFIYFQKP